MAKKSNSSVLQAHLRSTLSLLRELDKVRLDLAVQGETSEALERLTAAARQLVQAHFDYVEWQDPG